MVQRLISFLFVSAGRRKDLVTCMWIGYFDSLHEMMFDGS